MTQSAPRRYAKRWKRWTGYYLLVGFLWALVQKAVEIVKRGGPIVRGDVYEAMILLAFAGWGLYWIVTNPKKFESDAGSGIPGSVVLAAVLLAALLFIIYQVYFFPSR